MTNAWLLLCVTEGRQHGGNDGYDDLPDAYYSWDSTVPHSGALQVGDKIALWDKRRLLGTSVIEEISRRPDVKIIKRCPHPMCGDTKIKERTTTLPLYRCQVCGHEFDVPRTATKPVHKFVSRHDAGWRNFEGVLNGSELRELCTSPKSQLSMRPLLWHRLQEKLKEKVGRDVGFETDMRAVHLGRDGHALSTVRVRLGQSSFRAVLLHNSGSTCAFTGPAPQRVLEAGHLYSYAALGHHEEHGGLLLRRDIHCLFDDGQLAVDPRSLRVSVGVEAMRYSQYEVLDGALLHTDVSAGQLNWLQSHWQQHREGSLTARPT